jgi:hypothetical protein
MRLMHTLFVVVFGMLVGAVTPSCAALTSDGATKVTQTTVTAAKIAACSQGVLVAFEKAGDRSETAYALLAGQIAQCVQEALGEVDDPAGDVKQAAIAAGVAASMRVKRPTTSRDDIDSVLRERKQIVVPDTDGH